MMNFSKPFKTRHVFVPFGTDFAFQFAKANYMYLEKLIEYVNSNYEEGQLGNKFRFRMSTVDEYFQALKKTAAKKKVTWQSYSGDFFPYNGIYGGHYWTGYFSSRSNYKRLIRTFTGIAQLTDTLIGVDTLRNRSL